MKILALMTYDVFRLSFGWALESLGHQVYHLNTIHEELMEDAIQTFHPDLCVDMGWDIEHYKQDVLARVLKRNRLFHLYFAEEDYWHFERWSKLYVQQTKPEFVLTRSKNCIPEYEKMGIASAYLDVGCAPEFHRPVSPNPKFACEISIVVNPHFIYAAEEFRKKSIEDLVIPLFNKKFDTNVWGRQWDDVFMYYNNYPRSGMYKGTLPFHLTPQVYNSAKINISVQSVIDQISNRTYDILTSGGFLLTSDTPGVRSILTPGIHCEVSRSPEETLEKVAYYLKHDEKRNKIAKTGCEFARERFAYKLTLPKVWPKIEKVLQDHKKKI